MNNLYKYFLLLLFFTQINSCKKNQFEEVDVDEPINDIGNNFSVNENYILNNNIPYNVKGVVYVPGYPGYLPWEIENSISLPTELKNSISKDLIDIKNMGANTVRLWGAPKYCYEVIKDLGELNFIQTIWIDGEQSDFQNESFKDNTKRYIREVVDRIYSVFNDNSPPIIAFLIGNELSELSILSTNAAHPNISSFSGNYISTSSNITATEAFIAEMADYTRTYEFNNYGNKTLLSYANEIRTFDIIDIPFLDFISHNAYSYAVPYYRPNTSPGSNSGTIFQGWLEEIKSKHTNKPLLITETGLSVSPNANHNGPPNYGYGGNTESEQALGIKQNLNDINTSSLPIAGACIHEYLDAWWKFGLQDSYSQDPDDIEEWFGLAKLKDSNNWYTTEFRSSYYEIKNSW